MRILRALFHSDISYTPLNLIHFSPLDLHKEVFVAHSIYHHLKHEHISLVSSINNFVDLNRVISTAISFGRDLIEHEFPSLYKDLYDQAVISQFVLAHRLATASYDYPALDASFVVSS